MADGTGQDIPLVAVAHGSRDPRAAATVEALLDEVRLARPGLPVRTAYLDHAAPSLGQALSGLDAAVVLPLLLTEAYHSRVDLPAALNEARARDPRLRVRYGATLGPHPLLLATLERRLAEAGVVIGDPDTAVVLVSAGSSDPRANGVVARMARDWGRPTFSGAASSFSTGSSFSGGSGVEGQGGGSGVEGRGWWAVTAAYASAAEPTPARAVALLREAGAPRVAVAPYLLAPGYFADKVRRTTLEAGADVVADVLGPAPELAEVLLERYATAAHAPAGAAAS
ncbi:CbiX/SirB N-terminal domain-containing protein [Nonomuraea sp. NPDC050680]|uniref:sirohydrochlorin chelatase n=1 Tax=Nonomuraea sp. NPDC050680 TaxID=3154630 RepID=UPI0033E85CEA